MGLDDLAFELLGPAAQLKAVAGGSVPQCGEGAFAERDRWTIAAIFPASGGVAGCAHAVPAITASSAATHA